MGEDLGDELVFLIFGFAQFGGAEVDALKQALEVVLAVMAESAGLDVFQDAGEVLQDEVIGGLRALGCDPVEQLGGF